jgi:hypothetical protein
MIFRASSTLLLALVLSGCANLFHPVSTRIYEARPASSASAQTVLVMSEQLDWHSSTNGDRYDILLPQGIYHVEARDDDYLYYQAPERVSLGKKKIFADQGTDGYDGGIFISRKAGSKYSAGAYIDFKSHNKLLLFFFDSRFTKQEGKSWHYVSD